MPDASYNRFVCIAAISCVHCNINTLFGIPNTKKGRRNRRPFAVLGVAKAFSSEVDTGSRKENASKQNIEPGTGSIGGLTPPPASAADRARRNRGSRRPDGRRSR